MDPKRLKDVALFQGLSRKELEQVSRWTDEVDIPEGQRLAEQGTFAYEFFVIEEGSADVLKDGQRIRTLGPGDFFGEIGLLETERRTATVVATTSMRLVVMTSRDFSSMKSNMPRVADQIQKKIEERLARDREA